MLIKGGVTLITRGYGQTVTLEPYLYAEDPDYPSMQVTVAMVMVGISENKQNISSTRGCSSAGSVGSSPRRCPRTRRTRAHFCMRASFSFTPSHFALVFGVNISWYLDGDFIPNERLEGATSGGCFGNGPSKFFLHDHSSLYLLRIGRLYRCPVLVQNKVILFDFLCYNNYLLQGQLMKPSVC